MVRYDYLCEKERKQQSMKEIAPEISVIVPIYKVERYLREALDSMIGQTYRDWECILVDDGSPDSSGAICDEYAARDERFVVVHKENGGVSSARNAGLRHARGRYIGFVDPDDWAEPNYLERLHSLITEYDADVAQCGYRRCFTGFTHEKPIVKKLEVLDHKQAAVALLSKNRIPSLLWSKLYRREIINQEFPEGKTYEDAYTMPHWFEKVNKAVLSPEILYNYRTRKGSITKIGVAHHYYDFITACHKLAERVNAMVPELFDEEAKNAYEYKIYVEGAKTISRKERDNDLRKQVMKKISDEIKLLDLPSPRALSSKIRKRGMLLASNPSKFERRMRFVNLFDFHARFRSRHLYD